MKMPRPALALFAALNPAFRVTRHAAAAGAALTLAFAASAPTPPPSPASLVPATSRITIEPAQPPAPAPLFFNASADHAIRVGAGEVAGEIKLSIRILQGRPETLTFALTGDGEIASVTGTGLRDWAVRKASADTPGKRFLDLRPMLAEGQPVPGAFEFVLRTQLRDAPLPGKTAPLLLGAGNAAGFDARVRVQAEPAVDLRLAQATGLIAQTNAVTTASPNTFEFTAHGEPRLEFTMLRRGAAIADAELTAAQLTGRLDATTRSVEFTLRAQARIETPGARLRLLAGRAALSVRAAGDGWRAELVTADGGPAYEIVFERKGVIPLEIAFAAALDQDGDWQRLDFRMPAGAVVPLTLAGLGDTVEFDPNASVVPALAGATARGFLPANGRVALAWKRTRDAAEGALAFTSTELTEVRVGAGLLRQTAQISLRVLQGKLSAVQLRVDGPGEILGVEGPNILAWKIAAAADGTRSLDVQLSRALGGEVALTVRSQAAIGDFPARLDPLRLTPLGAVRHAGFVRIANAGAVRLEIAEAAGLMQLAPAQFPGTVAEEGAKQIFVYRFPSAERRFRLLASQIAAEVSVSQVLTYELTETDRVLHADVELDVREAPLREWPIGVPADYTVVAVQGAEVADYAVESAVRDERRVLKVVFARPIEGRHLLRLRLEKNLRAAAGDWALPALAFPQAKAIRGHVAAGAAPGYRLVPGATQKLVEVPLSFFPQQRAGLQQAWRLREGEWSATLAIEALAQSVQADVFHLYALKEGEVSASILFNYFVVGAPASEWRIEVPETAGNIDVIGQGVRREWRREGNAIVVPLQTPALGASTLLVTFSEPMSARGGTIQPGNVRPVNVQTERGYVQVASPVQVKHRIARAENLLKLEPLELPAEYRAFTSSPSLAVYQYTARPFALELGIEWYQPGDTVDQVIDFAKLASQVSRDGQVVTEAEFFVKTRGRKALRLQLPAAAKLWEARVDGQIVTARADGAWTLVQLPARLNPSEPVKVALRLGQLAEGGRTLALAAPKMAAPMVIGEWKLQADAERLLVIRGGNALVKEPNLTETGFEWLASHAPAPFTAVLLLAALAALARRSARAWLSSLGLFAALAAIVVTALLTLQTVVTQRPNLRTLELAATVVSPESSVTIDVANVPAWQAMLSWWGVAAVLAGVAAWFLARSQSARTNTLMRSGAIALLATGILAQRFGAPVFFLALGGAIFFGLALPLAARLWRDWRSPESAAPAVSGAVTVLALLLGGAALLVAPPAAHAAQASPPAAAAPAGALQSLVQRWEIRGTRLFAEVDVTVRGAAGESFLLLTAPAVLTEFTGEGLRVGKVERDGGSAYFIAPEREGLLSGRARFELAVPDFAKGLALPTGPAALQRITLLLDQGGWEFTSTAAVQITPTPNLAADHSGATLLLAPNADAAILPVPRRRDLTNEATQFVAEAANLFLPAPGVVSGTTRVTIRPTQGRVAALELVVPEGFTVGDVSRGPIGAWRFDPEKRRLHVAIAPAQSEMFAFTIETQRGATNPPFDLALEPLRVLGAANEVGMVGLAFGNDAQSEAVTPTGMSAVNLADFDTSLLPRNRERQALAVLHAAFRYSAATAVMRLRVAPVAPEVRVAAKHVLSIGDDRLVLAADLNVAITRVGVFKLGVAIPAGLEVEAVSGAALSHWTESEENGARSITLHLKGRTLGEQAFALTLVGAAPGAQTAWRVPQVRVHEATRQTGELQLVPEKGIRLRATERTNVSELDPRTLGGARPGTLAFRLLQADWALALAVETLDPWITVQALQEVVAREGQTLTRLHARYRVDNAAVKSVRVHLPNLSETQTSSVRASGPAVSDIVPVAGTPGLWEIRFQRAIAGETAVVVEFQGPAAREQNRETITTPTFEGARQVTQFVAVRSAGRLELEAPTLPRGWQRVDWSAVPPTLHDRGDRSVPALAYRVAEPEAPLAVVVRRHEIADALKLRVTSGSLATLFSPRGPALTAVDLQVEVTEKSTLRARLPEGAQLFNTFVNGESVSVVREADVFLFHVAPQTARDRSARVRFVYAVMNEHTGRVALRGPALNVPLENVTWRVVLPPGHELARYEGGLRLVEQQWGSSFGEREYSSFIVSKRAADVKSANDSLQTANLMLQRGSQLEAGELLQSVARNGSIDLAANEDARVQLRTLKTEQAMLGLNTRRQRLYLDNSGDVRRNEQLEQAANINPFMRGDVNWDPSQVDQLLMGNTAEENTALRGIAARIVEQQLAAEPAPSAIDVTLPETGRVVTFSRSVQVDGGEPLELRLDLEPARKSGVGLGLAAVIGLGLIGGIVLRRRDA